jgi:hypothetical protein
MHQLQESRERKALTRSSSRHGQQRLKSFTGDARCSSRSCFFPSNRLTSEQAYVVHDDYHWVIVENGVPLNHYWRDYKQSLSSWIHSGWNDGDPLMYG